METGRSIQKTLGTCKLSLFPLPSGLEIEFTDFETDMTWLSGRHYVRLVTADNPSFMYHVLDRVEWGEIENGAMIRGRLGPSIVTIGYRLRDEPMRLEERTVVTNTASSQTQILSIRVGPSWTPPGFWPPIPCKPEGSQDDFRHLSETASMGRLVYFRGQAHWIISDGERFLAATKPQFNKGAEFPVDYLMSAGRTLIVIGGIKGVADVSHALRVEPGYELAGYMTKYFPGKGGFKEAMERSYSADD